MKQITVSKLNLLKQNGTGIAKLEKDNSGNKAGRPSGNTPPPYQSQLPHHIFCPVRRGFSPNIYKEFTCPTKIIKKIRLTKPQQNHKVTPMLP
jgi:hypothetical protein